MIINKTKHRTISKKEIVCQNIFSQSLGLMFRKKQNLLMIFNRKMKVHLHTCWVFFPIDVLILDEQQKIIEIKRNFKPFDFWNSKQPGKYLVELGFKSDYEVGDKLEIAF